MAWNDDKCGKDKDFILLLNSENGAWTHNTLHDIKYFRNGKWYSDAGLCGISAFYYPKEFKKTRTGTVQDAIDACCDLYKQGTTFYGWPYRHQRGRNIIFP